MARLKDKVVVITGASSGFGQPRHRQGMRRRGPKVVVSDVHENPNAGGFEDDAALTTVAQDPRQRHLPDLRQDVADPRAVRRQGLRPGIHRVHPAEPVGRSRRHRQPRGVPRLRRVQLHPRRPHQGRRRRDALPLLRLTQVSGLGDVRRGRKPGSGSGARDASRGMTRGTNHGPRRCTQDDFVNLKALVERPKTPWITRLTGPRRRERRFESCGRIDGISGRVDVEPQYPTLPKHETPRFYRISSLLWTLHK